ncbi:hypothetical protein [Nitratireductor pacificus]|uniref:Uncharacterized protein n=1 Tax=Nitratireductor pacificus pht-3B TaxID=391937 RepID=K2M7U1_9HYPH|nr:hypothetical protein [Nitratireductor pacificus]EKF17055.1 hypothetical protein NA2_19833 [Nitratireductor pacificus pht-3B]
MIIEHDEAGRIIHVVSDPVPTGLAAMLRERGHKFLDLPPEPLPAQQTRDPETGHLLFDADGEPVLASPGMRFAACDILTDHVVDGAVVRRPSCGCSLDIAGCVVSLSDLPGSTTLTFLLDPADWASAVQVEVEGVFSLEVDEAGPLRIRVAPPWPYIEETFDVEIE